MAKKCVNVGGQAVIEGVMMRSPRSFAVAVRRPNGEIVVREEPWVSLSERVPGLKIPGVRGITTLFESMWNGMSALNFSANEAMAAIEAEEAARQGAAQPGAAKAGTADGRAQAAPLTSLWALPGRLVLGVAVGAGGGSAAATVATMGLALVMAVTIFKGVPHFLTYAFSEFFGLQWTMETFAFHLMDGLLRMGIFVAYIWAISRLKDIHRLFQYHGAEHKSIYAYEKGAALTVEEAAKFTRLHPRCGTSFLIVVLIISVFLFAAVFPVLSPHLPLVPEAWGWPVWVAAVLNQMVNVIVKAMLVIPMAGLSYEFIRFSGKHRDAWAIRALMAPGLWMQRLTTQEPTREHLEVALVALQKTLWRERQGEVLRRGAAEVQVYTGFAEAGRALA